MIKLIAIGSIKEKYLKDGINDYLKRISKYSKIELIEIDDDNSDNGIINEKNKITKAIKPNDYIITLDIKGEKIDSVSFAKKIDKIFISHPSIAFIIGGSNGLHDDIKKLSNFNLSFSDLTFPHQLFRLLLLEQIYRIYKINNNETYHK